MAFLPKNNENTVGKQKCIGSGEDFLIDIAQRLADKGESNFIIYNRNLLGVYLFVSSMDIKNGSFTYFD